MAKKSNPNNKPYYAEKYMLSLTGNTKSLNKLEQIVQSKDVNDQIATFAIAAYIFYCKPEVNKVKYPNLFEQLQIFKKDKGKSTKLNKYYQAEAWIKYQSIKSVADDKNKSELSDYIEKVLAEKNISINFAAKKLNIPQPTLYKVIVKKEISAMSIVKLSNIVNVIGDF